MSTSRNYRSFTFHAPWYWIPPKGELRSLLLGLHGMAQEGERFGEKLAPLLDQGVGLILPSGPYPMEVRGRHGARQGYAWYIFTGDQPGFMESMQLVESVKGDPTGFYALRFTPRPSRLQSGWLFGRIRRAQKYKSLPQLHHRLCKAEA